MYINILIKLLKLSVIQKTQDKIKKFYISKHYVIKLLMIIDLLILFRKDLFLENKLVLVHMLSDYICVNY